MGYRSDSIAISRDVGPLRFQCDTVRLPRAPWADDSQLFGQHGIALVYPIEDEIIINSVQTRGIVKTSGFTRGICKNWGFY